MKTVLGWPRYLLGLSVESKILSLLEENMAGYLHELLAPNSLKQHHKKRKKSQRKRLMKLTTIQMKNCWTNE